MVATAKLFKKGSFQAVLLPKDFRLPGREVAIHREGNRIILEPIARTKWPRNFFRSIRIGDPALVRLQGPRL